jgi:hypothetical protein
MTDDATFERDLRAMLTARDPGPAPAGLAFVVRERIRSDQQPRRIARWGAWIGAAGAVAATAAVFIVALWVANPVGPGPGPGASLTPDATPPYVMQAGDGVVTGEHVPLFQGLAALIAFAALLLVAIRTKGKRQGIAAALGSLVIAFVVVTIGTSDALVFRDGVYGVTPYRTVSDGEPGLYVAVTGDQPFHLVLTVTNGSRLPLDLLGLIEPESLRAGPDGVSPVLPRFVGIARLPDWDVVLTSAQSFERVTIPAGAQVTVAVLGMAGVCALPAAGPDGQGGIDLEHVGLVYEQLTIVHTQDFTLPEPVKITTSMNGCP